MNEWRDVKYQNELSEIKDILSLEDKDFKQQMGYIKNSPSTVAVLVKWLGSANGKTEYEELGTRHWNAITNILEYYYGRDGVLEILEGIAAKWYPEESLDNIWDLLT